MIVQFLPINDKVKELIRAVALPIFLAPLHIQTRVKFDNSNVLVVVRTFGWPDRACHHKTSIHRISSNLSKDDYILLPKEGQVTLAPWAIPSMSMFFESFRLPSRSKVQSIALPSSLMKRQPPSNPSVYPVAMMVSPSSRRPRIPPCPEWSN